jgi:hypothetical protein
LAELIGVSVALRKQSLAFVRSDMALDVAAARMHARAWPLALYVSCNYRRTYDASAIITMVISLERIF